VSRIACGSLILPILIGCHSDESPADRQRSEHQRVAEVPAAELARSHGLELRPEVAEGVKILVVDAATRRPVADALVVSVDEVQFTYWDSDDGGIRWNSRSLLKESGEAYATSIDGITHVARHELPRSIFVWRGANFGRTTIEEHDPDEHVVTLAPKTLEVEVVDRSGLPAVGIPVQVGKCALEPMSLGTTIGTTGPDGRLEIPALDLERGVHRSCGRRALITLGMLVGEFELRPIDAPHLEPVRFVLPDSGEVDFEIQSTHPWPPTDRGRPPPRYMLSVSGIRHGEPRGRRREREEISERTITLPLGTGTYRIEHVELGMTLEVRLTIPLRDSWPEWSRTFEDLRVVDDSGTHKRSFAGPTTAGEVRHVVLESEKLGAPIEDLETDKDREASKSTRAETPEEEWKRRQEEHADLEATRAEQCESSSIDVAVQLDVPIAPCWLSARLDDNREPYETDSCPWIDVNGRATLRNVPAGMHSVTITERRLSGGYEEIPLCRIDDVVVKPREHLRDRRLLKVDLRGRLRVHHLDVIDDRGNPLSGRIHFTRRDDPAFSNDIWFQEGRIDFLSSIDDGTHASLVVDRFRVLDLDVDSCERELDGCDVPLRRKVVMKRGIPIRLALAPGFELPPEPHDPIYLGVSEAPHWDQSLDELRTVELRPGADLRFDLAEPGEWTVIFLRSQDTGHDKPTIAECHAVEATITVANDSREQLVTVTPDRDCWDRLVETLRRDSS
jgi:hypothetical protein